MIDLKTFLNQIHQVDDDILDKYLEHWQEYHLPKKTTMTAPGESEESFRNELIKVDNYWPLSLWISTTRQNPFKDIFKMSLPILGK
ncbi:hypothetical protein ACOKFD_15130 [Flagellimonas sp. S174]|uniref:hypothetical protein n=1 Tax=Flagellimonas sp. S174 TaxID=3410790 RepID=UPI003BF463A5